MDWKPPESPCRKSLSRRGVVTRWLAIATACLGALTSTAMFERHLDLVGRRFRFTTLDEIGEHLAAGRPFTERVAAVTFDDGYRDNYECAFPILKRRGIPAAVFVVTDLVGTARPQLADRLYLINQHALARWGDRVTRVFRRLREAEVPATALHRVESARRDAVSITRAMLSTLPQSDLLRIMELLRVRTNAELVQQAIKLGLVAP